MRDLFHASLKFNSLPSIGFAHHFYTENYSYSYGKDKKSFEIVYVKSGGIEAELYGKRFEIPEGSIFLLFRHLPISLKSVNGAPQSHCSVQAEFNYDFSLIDDFSSLSQEKLFLPFVTLPSFFSEEIKKELFSIVSDVGTLQNAYSLSSSIKFLNILRRIDEFSRKNFQSDFSSSSLINYKVKKYIAKNIDKKITLQDISLSLNLTSGYINHIFKKELGLPIMQYVNNEKAKRISELMQNQNLTFKTACLNVGITDFSYGYRLFKKHTGLTPSQFIAASFHNK